jgi:hypothetical protein
MANDTTPARYIQMWDSPKLKELMVTEIKYLLMSGMQNDHCEHCADWYRALWFDENGYGRINIPLIKD